MNIFIKNNEILYSDVKSTIPKKHSINKINDWENKYNIEYRWRFIELNKKKFVEISKKNKNKNVREYKNSKGEWVERTISLEYDKYVYEKYYYYI